MRALAAIVAGALLGAGSASAESALPVATAGSSGTLLQVPVRSLMDLRFQNVVRQAYDLSCGAAALATLLTYFYQDARSEKEIIESIAEFGDAEQIARSGFSMLELKHYGERLGYVVEGFKVDDVAKLERIKIPYIALIEVRGYRHFVVIKRVAKGRVYIADPAFGNRTTDVESFDREWSQVILGVMHADNSGSSNFAMHATVEGRADEIPILTDFGLRPITPSRGMFR